MKREFDPEKLRVVGRLAWMKDGDEGNWFSVPDSNDQLVFNERGSYVHALTGVSIEILYLDTRGARSALSLDDRPDVSAWSPVPPDIGYAAFSDLVQYGVDLYTALSGRPDLHFWSADHAALFEWMKRSVVIFEPTLSQYLEIVEYRFDVCARKEVERRYAAAVAAFDSRQSARRKRWKEEVSQRSVAWHDRRRRIAEMRSRQDYDDMFLTVYGKRQSALTDADNRNVVGYARAVVEYRLKVGRWAEMEAEENRREPPETARAGR